jgi:hypothetical protein
MHRAIVESNAAERQRLSELVAQLREEDFGRELDAGWTVATALVHVAFWDRRISVLIDRWTKDGPSPSQVDLDATNDALLPQWRLIPPQAAVQELLAAMEEMDRKVEALPADLAAEIVERNLGNIDRGDHRREHREQIERSVQS